MMAPTISLTAVRNALLPGVFDVTSQFGKGVKDVDLNADFVDDCIYLVVRHVLASREEIEAGDYRRLFYPRLNRAVLCETGNTAKSARADRRRLIARGAEARRHKPRPKVVARRTYA